MKNKHMGSNFDDFLKEEGIYEEVNATAIKRVIAMQISDELEKMKISKTSFAKKLHTSRAEVDRILNPENDSLTLQTLNRTAIALGKKLEIHFV